MSVNRIESIDEIVFSLIFATALPGTTGIIVMNRKRNEWTYANQKLSNHLK
jgi:hypothetical protein